MSRPISSRVTVRGSTVATIRPSYMTATRSLSAGASSRSEKVQAGQRCGQRLGNAAVIADPQSNLRGQQLKCVQDSSVIVIQLSAKNRLVVRDAVPERAKTVELLMNHGAAGNWLERSMQQRSPQGLLVRFCEQTNPKAEARRSYHPSGRLGLAFAAQQSSCHVNAPSLCVFEADGVVPVIPVHRRRERMNRVAKRHFESLEWSEEC